MKRKQKERDLCWPTKNVASTRGLRSSRKDRGSEASEVDRYELSHINKAFSARSVA